jgi:uncharacterized Zn-finger protein
MFAQTKLKESTESSSSIPRTPYSTTPVDFTDSPFSSFDPMFFLASTSPTSGFLPSPAMSSLSSEGDSYSSIIPLLNSKAMVESSEVNAANSMVGLLQSSEEQGKQDWFPCLEMGCEKTFVEAYHLKTHMKYFHETGRQFHCNSCDKSFRRHHDLRRHDRSLHQPGKHNCLACHKSFSRPDALKRHTQRPASTCKLERIVNYLLG